MSQLHPRLRSTMGSSYELRFQSLFDVGRALSFPCNERGGVDESALSQHALQNYRRACKVVGIDWATPKVVQLAQVP